MAQQIIKPVKLRPARRLLNRYLHHLSPPPLLAVTTTSAVNFTSFIKFPIGTSHRSGHFKSRGAVRPNRVPMPVSVAVTEDSEFSDSDDSDSSDTPKGRGNRNAKKREARRAVRWGMDLALFSDTQIKRILRIASLEQEVYEALMLVKRLGPDVREGKRRQYNLIGKLLKRAEPQLMDTLIKATKDGDHSRIHALAGSVTSIDNDEEESEETDSHDDEEISQYDTDVATKWYDGLINKDVDITNEVYSIHSVDFDRQELRKLVRKVHSFQERQDITEENKEEVDASLAGAKKSLTKFVQSLAKRTPID